MKDKICDIKNKLPEWVTAGVAFIYYWLMGLYKLTQAPIWQDEAMEFYCSIPVKGSIEGVTKLSTMYERMAYIQQQPPLYNWLMCLWLQVSEGEWWFRFSSVVFGFIAALGLYFVMRRLCSRYMAAFCVIIYSSIYILMYYVKEASEYIVLVALLMWMIYVFELICEKLTLKRVAVFDVLCVAAVYTHYGAAFAVVPMALSVLVIAAMRKDYANLKAGLGMFGVAGVCGGIPLIYFFVIPQSSNAVSTLFSEREIIIEGGNIFNDLCNAFACVFKWCMLDIDRDSARFSLLWNALIIVLLLVVLYVIIKTKSFFIKAFFWCNVAVFMLYYVVTKLNLYAYGWYGNRWNMFIFPLWLIMVTLSLHEFVGLLRQNNRAWIAELSAPLSICLVLGGFLYCLYGDYRISNHWWKSDLRTVVDEWYDLEGYDTPTILDFHQRYAFTYYFTHDSRYDEEMWENITYNDEIETYANDDKEIWEEYLSEIYGDELPSEIYLVTNDWNAFCRAFEDLGYTVEPVVDTTAKLYYVYMEE